MCVFSSVRSYGPRVNLKKTPEKQILHDCHGGKVILAADEIDSKWLQLKSAPDNNNIRRLNFFYYRSQAVVT